MMHLARKKIWTHIQSCKFVFLATQKKLSHPKRVYAMNGCAQGMSFLLCFLSLVNHKAVLCVCVCVIHFEEDIRWMCFESDCSGHNAASELTPPPSLFSSPLYMKSYILSNTLVWLERIKHRHVRVCVCAWIVGWGWGSVGGLYILPAVQCL